MASIHFQKTLIHRATVQRTTPVQSSSGELIDSWAGIGTIDGRYVRKEHRIAQEGVGFMMLLKDMFLVNDGVTSLGEDIIEEDRIVDIELKADDTTVDAGPFTIESLLNRNALGAHHISLVLERIE